VNSKLIESEIVDTAFIIQLPANKSNL